MNKLKGLLTLLLVSVCAVSARSAGSSPTFTAASYNLRQANHSDSVAGNGWGRRLPVLAELIRFHGFDIFGTQEGFKHQLDSLIERLPGYAYTGIGREDGKDEGEHSAIFYRTDMFELLDHGDFWLSETPDRPGLGWDAVCPRICSWGKFLHYPSGQVFVFMNLHMDHVGKQARIESAKLVKERIGEVAFGAPAMVTGDFNVDQTHQSYRTMLGNGDMNDSYQIAEIRYAPNGTFNSYHTDDYSVSRIDHVFVTPGVKVLKYGVLTDTYRTDDGDGTQVKLGDAPGEIVAHRYTPRTPSDHFPVMVVLTLPEPQGFVSLKNVYDRIASLPDMETGGEIEKIAFSGQFKGLKGEAAVCGNASPRAGLLEAVSVVPSDKIYFNEENETHNTCRIYFNPTSSDGHKGEALYFIVGHGGNDTVVMYIPSVSRTQLAKITGKN